MEKELGWWSYFSALYHAVTSDLSLNLQAVGNEIKRLSRFIMLIYI